MKQSFFYVGVCLTVLGMLFTSVALAFVDGGRKWSSSLAPYYINTGWANIFGIDAITNAAGAWNSGGSGFKFVYQGTTSLNSNIDGEGGDGYSVVGYRALGNNGYIAIASLQPPDPSSEPIIEADITFNTDKAFATNGDPFSYDVQSVATHEFGHWLRLAHSTYGYCDWPWVNAENAATMCDSIGKGDIYYRTLEQDDRDGIRYIYPAPQIITSITPASGLNNNPVGISSIGASGSGFALGWDREIGLQANWRLDDNSNAATDVSGNDVISVSSSGTSVVTGKLNNGKHLTNTATVNFGDKVDISQTSPATISFWYKGVPTSGQWIIDKEEDSGQYRGYSAFFLNLSGEVNLVWRIGQNDVGGKRTYCSNNTAVPSDGQWHHYAITQQGGTNCVNNVSIYIDGVSQSIVQWDQGIGDSGNSTSPLYLGSSISGYSAVGDLDEARIYNRVLSQDEVSELKNVSSKGQVKLTKSGQSDISCSKFSWTSPTALSNGNCAVTNAAAGLWNVIVTNPDNTAGSLANGFNIVSTGSPQCNDGLDNDSDSKIDFPADNGCTSSSWNDEYNYGGDTSPPVISLISASNITSTTAVLNWTTNEISTSDADYGFTTNYGLSAEFNGDLVTSHSLPISNLYPNTLYHYRVKSRDPSGNEGISGDYTFTTSSDSNAPIISSFSPLNFTSTIQNNRTVTNATVTGSNFKSGWDKEANLIGNWRMDETANTILNDVSGNTISGQAVGPAIVSGKINNGRNFAGTSDYIYFTNAQNLSQTSPATVSFWWKGTPTTLRWLVNKEELNGQYRGFSAFFYNLGNGVELVWRIGQSDVGGKRTYCSTMASPLNDGNWHLITITQSGGTSCGGNVAIYIDASAQSIHQWDSGSGSSASSEILHLGYVSGGFSSIGAFDETRIYTRALSSPEVLDLFQSTGPGNVKFTRIGSSDIPCVDFIRSSSTLLTSGTCNTTGYSGGAWDVSVANPNGYTGILPNGFNLTIASNSPLRFFANLFRSIWHSFSNSGNVLALTASEEIQIASSLFQSQKPVRLTKISIFIPPQLNLNTATLPWDSLSGSRLNKSTATLPLLIETIE